MASDSYLKIDGIKGECTASGYTDCIEVLSFSHTITQPASTTASSAGGHTIARSEHAPFVITKYIDLASPKLYEACCSGAHIKEATLTLLRASGGAPVVYMTIKMEQVIIAKVSPGNTETNGLPIESISFNYSKINWQYTQQKRADGSKGGNVAAGWSLAENKSAA